MVSGLGWQAYLSLTGDSHASPLFLTCKLVTSRSFCPRMALSPSSWRLLYLLQFWFSDPFY